MNLRQVLIKGTQTLKEAGIDGPDRDARLLLARAVDLPASRLILEPDRMVSDLESKAFNAFLTRRVDREPVSRILGSRHFWGRDFDINSDVLDPRPETESLIAEALQLPTPDRFIDLGCGSGIIPVTLLAEWPTSRAVAADVSAACLQTTQTNARKHGVDTRMTVMESDWLSNITGQFDLILSNPPYISDQEMQVLDPEVANHDPHLALTPGGDGLSPYKTLADGAMGHLNPGGWLMVEIGWKQGPDVKQIFTDAGLSQVSICPDLDGRDRVVKAMLKP